MIVVTSLTGNTTAERTVVTNLMVISIVERTAGTSPTGSFIAMAMEFDSKFMGG
jgi:hypothetical protein